MFWNSWSHCSRVTERSSCGAASSCAGATSFTGVGSGAGACCSTTFLAFGADFFAFPEFFALKAACKFHNCMHKNEPDCAVKLALEQQEIAESRS